MVLHGDVCGLINSHLLPSRPLVPKSVGNCSRGQHSDVPSLPHLVHCGTCGNVWTLCKICYSSLPRSTFYVRVSYQLQLSWGNWWWFGAGPEQPLQAEREKSMYFFRPVHPNWGTGCFLGFFLTKQNLSIVGSRPSRLIYVKMSTIGLLKKKNRSIRRTLSDYTNNNQQSYSFCLRARGLTALMKTE